MRWSSGKGIEFGAVTHQSGRWEGGRFSEDENLKRIRRRFEHGVEATRVRGDETKASVKPRPTEDENRRDRTASTFIKAAPNERRADAPALPLWMDCQRSEAEHIGSIRMTVGVHWTEGDVSHNLIGGAGHERNGQAAVIPQSFDQVRFGFFWKRRRQHTSATSARIVSWEGG